MSTMCVFELNKRNAIYFCGETVEGTITLKTTRDLIINEMCIVFLGEGKVGWDETQPTPGAYGITTRKTTHYRSRETYIHHCTPVYDLGILPADTYTYDFSIPLPKDCPTSCEGKYGHIRYEIWLDISTLDFVNNIYKKPVTVIKTKDLNLYPLYKVPRVVENSSSSCCWSCSKGTISCRVKVPFGAYAPGQIVKYTLQIANESTDDTEGYKIEFCQKNTFNAELPCHRTRQTTEVLVSKTFPDRCLRLSSRVLKDAFFIPATPSSTRGFNIICVEYILKITVMMPCCSSTPGLIVPLVIGTAPLWESLTANEHLNCDEQQPFLSSTNHSLNEEPESKVRKYNKIDSPVFEEAAGNTSPFIDTDIDQRGRVIDFKPLYPVYNKPKVGK